VNKPLGIRIPYSAIPMAALGVGALVGFALAALWHEAYRDRRDPVEPDSPDAGGRRWPRHHRGPADAYRGSACRRRHWARARHRRAVTRRHPGPPSCFEGEFDFGVPQFQVIHLPVLIAATAGFTLVLARAALRPRAARRTDLAGGGRLQRSWWRSGRG
jgi:hypothetical protein